MKKRPVAILCACLAISMVAFTVSVVTTKDSGQGQNGAGAVSYDGFYVDLGASASLGFQPDGVVKHNGRRTDTGYANDLVAIEASKGTSLELYQFGCPGETVQSMLNSGDACYKLPERQLLRATAFLKENSDEMGIVTIDLGFNDVRACLATLPINEGCAANGLRDVRVDMPLVLKELQNAAGPNVTFVGLDYGDPFLGYDVNSAHSEEAASESLQIMTELNAILDAEYANAGIAVANVSRAYESENTTPIALKGVGVVPTNVAEACTLTWYCTGYPYGPDDHPNNAGYRVIAQTIAEVLSTKH